MKLGFTVDFLVEFGKLVFSLFPLLLVLIAVISALAIWIGKREGWPLSDSLYFGFITATTVGYGDIHPAKSKCKYMAIVIALTGLMLTGIIVAIAVEAASIAHDARIA